jgi:oligoendopeptidase F
LKRGALVKKTYSELKNTKNSNSSLRMVEVASAFLRMLYRKWSSEKFQEEQFNEIFGIASSDGNI